MLIPGVISHATNVVEHPELVAERIVRLAKLVGRENVIAGTDCGFAQGPFYRRVHPSIMWAKLEALAKARGLPARSSGHRLAFASEPPDSRASTVALRPEGSRAMNVNANSKRPCNPVRSPRLDRLMDEAGIDVVLATSKHNVQYLLGGHRADFFDYMDATGVTRYLPVFVYPKGAPEKAAYIGHRLEKFQREINPMWTPETQTNTAGSVDAMQKAVDHIRKAGLKTKRIAPNSASCLMMPRKCCAPRFPMPNGSTRCIVLERQRVKKSPDELKKLKIRVGSGDRVRCRRSSPATARRDQGRGGRGVAARGNQPRADLRILPDHLRHQHEPRAVRAEVGEGRHHVDRFRRQLPRLYRRPLPHGDPGRAGCRA